VRTREGMLSWRMNVSLRALAWLVLLVALPACRDEGARSMNDISDNIPRLQQAAYEGDVAAYDSLRIVALDYAPSEFLFTWLMMANKNDYPPAYLDVYHAIDEECRRRGAKNFHAIDPRTQKLLVQYLTQASRKGMTEADTILRDIHNGRL
jgi:hypothetical protein